MAKKSVYETTPESIPQPMPLTESAPVITKTVVLSEALDLSKAKIDEGNRAITGVVLIRAGMSANRRYYSERALQEAVSIFEGAKAYANHPSKSDLKDRPERSIRDLTGWYSNVTYKEGKLLADRYFTHTQAGDDAWAIAKDITTGRAPASLAGLSINAVGKGAMKKFDDGEALEVESITSANSVDDVSQPAAGGGYLLTASVGNGDEITQGILESLTYEEWLQARSEFVERLKREWKQVRLDEATKAALAESDDKVKAAEVEALKATTALQEAQLENGTLKTANDKLMTEITSLRVDIAVREALEGVQLPAVYINDLRDELPKLSPDQWANKIERELSKAKRSGVDKVAVSNAGIQEASSIVMTQPKPKTEDVLLPRDDEDVIEWQERLARYKQNMR